MRISSFEIENYRSIECIKHSILDPRISCFIGGNGSGKSNILKAIASLKEDSDFDEDDFFIEANSDDEITISVTFMLEESDKELLQPLELKLKDVSGFTITKKQAQGGKPTLKGELKGYSGAVEKKLENDIKKITKAITNSQPSTEEDDTYLRLAGEVLNTELPADARNSSFVELISIAKTYHSDLEQIGVDEKVLQERFVFDQSKFAINNLFNKLSIELLSLDSYTLSNEAAIAELGDREKHPFLFDLLSISGKSAEDFVAAHGNRRINVSEQASERLTQTMQQAWASRGLPLVVQKDKNDSCISFCTRTPHGKAIPLTSTSEGMQWFLRFYTRLITAGQQSQRIIWLFDEPDRGLHAKSQQDLVKLIEKRSEYSQVLYCTHQPIMIQWHRLERINVVEDIPKDKQAKFGRGTKIHRRFWDDGEFDSPLKEVLKLFIGEDVLWTKEHVVIEGPSDYFYLVGWTNYFLQLHPDSHIWKEDFAAPHRTFVPAGSIHNIPLFLYFLTKKNNHKRVNWASVTDTGDDHSDIKKVISSTERLKHFSDRVIQLEKPEGRVMKGFDIEDLFDPQDFYDSAAEYYASQYPECKFPPYKAISQRTRITKSFDKQLKKMNPDVEGICFDKPGVAQHIYSQLVVEKKKYSDATIKNFRATLKAINKTFGIESSQIEEG